MLNRMSPELEIMSVVWDDKDLHVTHDGKTSFSFDTSAASLLIGAHEEQGGGNAGNINVLDRDGKRIIDLDGYKRSLRIGEHNATGGNITLFGGETDGGYSNIEIFRNIGGEQKQNFLFLGRSNSLRIGEQTPGEANIRVHGDIAAFDANGKNVFYFGASRRSLRIGEETPGEGDIRVSGNIVVRDASGNDRVVVRGDRGDVELLGADCAEEFEIAEQGTIHPGTVLVINDTGKLSPCEVPYDKRVAGIVSGAGGHSPGIILGKRPEDTRKLPIALNGKAYCNIDAGDSSIELGDLLTTSSTTGYAMKAEDPSKAFGAVIGKALRPLKEGLGQIPVLVALQ